MGATVTTDAPFAWLFRFFGAVDESSETPAPPPNPLVQTLRSLLRPVFEADTEAALWAAMDARAPDILRLLEAAPSREGGARDTYARARMAQGFEGEDAERFESAFAMVLFCRDATRARRELGGEEPEPFRKVMARANDLGESARSVLRRALRGMGAFVVIALAARCAIEFQAWQRRALVCAAWDASRIGVAEGVADLLRRGALPTLVEIMQRHGLFFPLPALREAALDELAERAQADPHRRGSYARLFDRIEQADRLPTYIGDHAELFRDVTHAAHERLIRFAAEDWLSGERSPEEILRSLGLLSVDLMALLDAAGKARPVERLRLAPPARAEILARLRADRLARNGAPQADTSVVARDVAASQRIEGVDVRPLLYAGATVGRG